jgi:hypothetical protein
VEYEQLTTLATAKDLGLICWDALGQQLVVEFLVGPPDSDRQTSLAIGLMPEVAEVLLRELSACIEERPFAAGEIPGTSGN